MIHIPLAVYLLFAAPLTALAVGFFVFLPRKPEWTHIPILLSCAVVTAAAAYLAARVYAGWGIDGTMFQWMVAGDWDVPFGVRIDGIGVSVLAMVSLVGALIHVYAAGYMKGEPGFARFFLVFHLFYLSMIGLLVSNNYVQFYLFWELVGMCSYFLIGYWMQKESARRAALQAFMTLRVADFGLMVAVLLLMGFYRHSRFAVLYMMVPGIPPGLLALLGVLFVWAAAGKSALFPLYFWLPDAMEGPTPVSALMHSSWCAPGPSSTRCPACPRPSPWWAPSPRSSRPCSPPPRPTSSASWPIPP
ncbi:MAG: proton-conducting transporter membrane subunit [Elusimicrobia bacterium]|nr:proton-conducting transporter membrane subunit [Elusimicrobiota bacterium]